MLFVALDGLTTDGHDFIPLAIDRGAAAVVCARNGFVAGGATAVRVENTRGALATIASEFYGHPSKSLKMVGITGTNGKTSVSFILKHLLESAEISTGLIGTIRYEIGERMIPAWRTTPESAETQNLMGQMVKAGCSSCVMEASSHAIDQGRVSEVEFNTVIFTNLTGDHLDYHKDMDSYLACKKKLFTGEAQGARPDYSIINIDDESGCKLNAASVAHKKYTYGIENKEALVRAEDIVMDSHGSTYSLCYEQQCEQVTVPLVGRYNVYNVLASVAGALTMGITWEQILKALPNTPSVPGRLEPVVAGQPFQVLVDYAHTDDALRNVLTTLKETVKGRTILVFGCGGSRDSSKRMRMGAVAADLADLTYITNDNPRKENPDSIAAQIAAGFCDAGGERLKVELERERAIEIAIGEAKEGDVVLIAGKGHETYQEYADTVIPFDDRDCALECLESLGYRN